jgi:hypothetical protein
MERLGYGIAYSIPRVPYNIILYIYIYIYLVEIEMISPTERRQRFPNQFRTAEYLHN